MKRQRKNYRFAHPESAVGLEFRNEGKAPVGWEYVGNHPTYGLLIFKKLPLWRIILGEW